MGGSETMSSSLIDNISMKVSKMEREMDYMDNRRRINNLVIHGLEEEAGESAMDTLEAVKSFAVNKLNLPLLRYVDARRVGNKFGDRPRIIICQFSSLSDKLSYKKAVIELRNLNVFVNDDFSRRLRDIRYKLCVFGRQKKSEGAHSIRLTYDKIFIDGVKYGYDEILGKIIVVSS
ncbi:uncharacterized protein [Centruroides vittatus]|uniref:uncharacterized protein n=1 Tax=Centruroides vittatus TaxID=120091 RepID=UPI0035106CAB